MTISVYNAGLIQLDRRTFTVMRDKLAQFEQRKKDHIQYALLDETEAKGGSGLQYIQLNHEALPDLDFDEIVLSTCQLGSSVPTPFLVSSMTAGHQNAININQRLMAAADTMGWAMGVGSQRRELDDPDAHKEWSNLRHSFPTLRLFSNIGISQLITTHPDDIKRITDNLDAQALQIHLNPLQECIQPEGTPYFKGALSAIETITRHLDMPVIVKETGCGFNSNTLLRLNQTGIKAVDISGFGGTHWGRIEGHRAEQNLHQDAAVTFKNWGLSTVSSLEAAREFDLAYEIWGSGGVRSGLDAAKLIALGANTIGFAKPMLSAAMTSTDCTIQLMKQIEYELKVALFCTGHKTLQSLQEDPHAIVRC